jgi:predicted O-methyltransferase YrrM
VQPHQSPFSNPESQTKQRNLYDLARDAREIIEVGFNAGFSCLLMLIANRESRITVVDINDHAYVVPCFEYLNANFPGRLTLRLGSSHDVLPLLEERKCDLIHIDGAHTFEDSRLDF